MPCFMKLSKHILVSDHLYQTLFIDQCKEAYELIVHQYWGIRNSFVGLIESRLDWDRFITNSERKWKQWKVYEKFCIKGGSVLTRCRVRGFIFLFGKQVESSTSLDANRKLNRKKERFIRENRIKNLSSNILGRKGVCV